MQLNDTKLRALKRNPIPGKHTDGSGLYLKIVEGGGMYWQWRIRTPRETIVSYGAYGWMSAGGWFATFAEINTAVAEAVKSVSITSTGPSGATDSPQLAIDVDAMAVAYATAKAGNGDPSPASGSGDNQVAAAVKDYGCGVGTAVIGGAIGGVAGAAAAANADTATGNCSVGQGIVSVAIKGLSAGQGSATIGTLPMVNPIIMSKNIGDYVMGLASTILFADAAANLIPGSSTVAGKVGGLAKDFTPVGRVISMAADGLKWIATMAVPMMLAGMVMSLYIPLIPFIIWMGGIITYSASFIEGLVAMPLHSLSHLDTDGEGMGQKTGHGYLFLLNTIARPSLMVIAFFIASTLVIVLGTIQTALFLPAIANSQGNSITGLASIVGLLIIFVVINVTLINGCFELIHVIPDQVIGFVGAGHTQSHLGKDAEGRINGMFMSVGRSAQGMLGAQASARRRSPGGPEESEEKRGLAEKK